MYWISEFLCVAKYFGMSVEEVVKFYEYHSRISNLLEKAIKFNEKNPNYQIN